MKTNERIIMLDTEYKKFREQMIEEGAPLCMFCKHFCYIKGDKCYMSDLTVKDSYIDVCPDFQDDIDLAKGV